jgi:hypothetical protein
MGVMIVGFPKSVNQAKIQAWTSESGWISAW